MKRLVVARHRPLGQLMPEFKLRVQIVASRRSNKGVLHSRRLTPRPAKQDGQQCRANDQERSFKTQV
jgi:hypothetical protein